MEIFLGTNNQHKAQEIREIFTGFTIITPKEAGIVSDPEETGTTFYGNALIKAKSLWQLTGKPVIADDSGLLVEALGGAPGIYSARYGNQPDSPPLTTEERNTYLLQQMGDAPNRKASFVCNLVYYLGPNRFYSIQETMEGEIISQPTGIGGFGYDPIFYLPQRGITVAQLSSEEKNQISHRGKAVRKLYQILIGDSND